MSTRKKGRTAGFTLIELIVVVVIIGVLAVIITRQLVNTSKGSKAAVLYESANKIRDNWNVLAITASTSNAVASSPFPDTGATALDVIFLGRSKVAPDKQKMWDQAGVVPLTDLVQVDTGVYKVSTYPVTLSGGGGDNPLEVSYDDVPDEVILLLVQKFGSNVADLSDTGDSVHPVIQYGPVGSGKRRLTILKK